MQYTPIKLPTSESYTQSTPYVVETLLLSTCLVPNPGGEVIPLLPIIPNVTPALSA
jgi:hypothetical protein